VRSDFDAKSHHHSADKHLGSKTHLSWAVIKWRQTPLWGAAVSTSIYGCYGLWGWQRQYQAARSQKRLSSSVRTKAP